MVMLINAEKEREKIKITANEIDRLPHQMEIDTNERIHVYAGECELKRKKKSQMTESDLVPDDAIKNISMCSISIKMN